MKDFKSRMKSVISAIAEYISLIAAVIASAYIVTTSQYKEYSDYTLLLWIISLLGLVAISIASERHFRLRKINKDIIQIKNSIVNKPTDLDGIFYTRKDLDPFEYRFHDAYEITITGGSLARLSDEYFGFFEKKLNEGCHLEVIMVNPNSKSAELLCKNIVYETRDAGIYSVRISESLQRFIELKAMYSQFINIYLTENVPPFGIIAKNLNRKEAEIQIEIYTYAVPTRDRIQFLINKNNIKTFQFFKSQIDILKKQSKEYCVENCGAKTIEARIM